MDDDDALRINKLHRFAKHSPRLVLHEYSHCEVPAGCGGVVLRWLDPATGRPCIIELGTVGQRGEVWLDGEPVPTALCNLKDGRRVIAIALRHDASDKPPSTTGTRPFTVNVRPDGQWRVELLGTDTRYALTYAEPPHDWQRPEFDDRAWPEAESCPAEVIAGVEKWQQRRFENALEAGQRVLAIDGERDRAWLRIAFHARVPERQR